MKKVVFVGFLLIACLPSLHCFAVDLPCEDGGGYLYFRNEVMSYDYYAEQWKVKSGFECTDTITTQAAQQICNTTSGQAAQECKSIVHNSNFDPEALRLCDAVSGHDKKNRCLAIIANREFKSNRLTKCKTIPSSLILDCLSSFSYGFDYYLSGM